MAEPFFSRLKRGWNAFQNRDPTEEWGYNIGPGYGRRPDRVRLNYGNERSIIASIYNKIALDVAGITIQHVRLDEDDRFESVIKSGLNECLTLQANIDQTGKAFIQDIVMSMFDEGSVAIVPVDTTTNPKITDSYDIQSMRTAKVVQWHPRAVRVRLYNDNTGLYEDLPFRTILKVRVAKNISRLVMHVIPHQRNPFSVEVFERILTNNATVRTLEVVPSGPATKIKLPHQGLPPF